MFMPHQPVPMRAVRYFLAFELTPMIGTGNRLAAAEAFKKSRRFVCIGFSRFEVECFRLKQCGVRAHCCGQDVFSQAFSAITHDMVSRHMRYGIETLLYHRAKTK